MKLPNMIGYGLSKKTLTNDFDRKYVIMIVATSASATYTLKFTAPKPIVGATSSTLTKIDPKQHGHGAITAIAVAAAVFFS